MAASAALAEPPEAIQRITLDECVDVTVPVGMNRVTTISLPGPIAAIDAVGVTTDGKTPAPVQSNWRTQKAHRPWQKHLAAL
jgi:hypothetical protein